MTADTFCVKSILPKKSQKSNWCQQHLWDNIDEISARIFEKSLSHKQKNGVESWVRKSLYSSSMFEFYLNFE